MKQAKKRQYQRTLGRLLQSLESDPAIKTDPATIELHTVTKALHTAVNNNGIHELAMVTRIGALSQRPDFDRVVSRLAQESVPAG
jgi:hypothetical protein